MKDKIRVGICGLGSFSFVAANTVKRSDLDGILIVSPNKFHREHNLRAKKRYEKFGFVEEGVKRHGVRIDGRYEDLICMGLLFD